MTDRELLETAGWKEMGDGLWGSVRDGCMFLGALERFAFLVAAAERTRMISEGWRQCAQGQRTTQFCGMVEQARLEEREAWPKLAPVISWLENGCDPQEAAKELRVYEAAIRARGQQSTEDNPSF